MRLLLRLDSIVAEGEGRIQRKMEVSIMLLRVQINLQFSPLAHVHPFIW